MAGVDGDRPAAGAAVTAAALRFYDRRARDLRAAAQAAALRRLLHAPRRGFMALTGIVAPRRPVSAPWR